MFIFQSKILFMNQSIKTFLLLTVIFSSCTIAKIGSKGPIPILLNQPSKQMELIQHIRVSKNIHFDYTNTIDAYSIIADRIALMKPDKVINCSIIIKIGVDNYFLNYFTFGLANSRKIVVEADFVKYQ